MKEYREKIRRYLLHALLKEVYSRSSDGTLNAFRKIIQESMGVGKGFPDIPTLNFALSPDNALMISREDLEGFMERRKGATTFPVLALLHKDSNFTKTPHQEHMHHRSTFAKENLKGTGVVDEETIEFYKNSANKVPNLQFLTESENSSKGYKSLEDWKERGGKVFCLSQGGADILKFERFREFYEGRKKLLIEELRVVLDIREENALARALAQPALKSMLRKILSDEIDLSCRPRRVEPYGNVQYDSQNFCRTCQIFEPPAFSML